MIGHPRALAKHDGLTVAVAAAFDDDAAAGYVRDIGAAKATVACLVDSKAGCTATTPVTAVIMPATAPVVVTVVIAILDATRARFRG